MFVVNAILEICVAMFKITINKNDLAHVMASSYFTQFPKMNASNRQLFLYNMGGPAQDF